MPLFLVKTVLNLLVIALIQTSCVGEKKFLEDQPPKSTSMIETIKYDWKDEKRDRVVPVKIFYPKDGNGPFPVIIFSHGLGGSREGYGYLGRYWAEHGYVSVHVQHLGSDSTVWEGSDVTQRVELLRRAVLIPQNTINRPTDITFAIDELERLYREDERFKGKLDLTKIGVAGHSFGAFTALATGGEIFVRPRGDEISFVDSRVKAVIAMSSPVPHTPRQLEAAFREIKIPVLHMTGTEDDSPIGETKAASRREPYDRITASNQYLVTFTGADHFVFSGRWRDQTGGEQDTMFQDFIVRSSTAFWDAFLKRDKAAFHFLTEDFAGELGNKGVLEKKSIVAP